MKALLLAIKHKLVVQFLRKPQTTKMKQKTLALDGSEKSMIPIIKGDVARLSFTRNKKLIPLEEFSAGTGISDLTIFSVDDKVLQERKQYTTEPLTSKSQIQVLLAILNGNTSLESITASVRLNKITVGKILKQFIDSGLVSAENEKYTATYTLPGSTSENIIAIEAKVKDWKSGVRQALRYKEYADYSYLAIYEDNIASCLNNIDIFKQFGIGLIGVSDNGINIHLKAAHSDMTTIENKLLAFERFVSIIDEGYQSFVVRNNFATNNAA